MSKSEEKSTDADQLNFLIPRIPKESLIDRATAENDRLEAESSACMQDLAIRQEIGLTAFKSIVDADSDDASEHDGFILSESSVRFVGFSPVVTTRMGQAHRNQRNTISAKMPCLFFPCTPVALLEFVDAAGGFFEVAPEFREHVETKHRAALLRSKNAALGAAAKKINSPIQAAKIDIHTEWEAWQAGGATFRGAADFARAMTDKYPAVTSDRTIVKWAGDWLKEKRGG